MARAAFILLAMLLLPDALAAASRCADCHFASPYAPAPNHLVAWDRSAHGRNDVGCEKCHGGDATTFEPILAHRGVLGSSNPASSVHRVNIPRTCGGCHPGPYVAFQDSRHYALVENGDRRAPTCVTCHDSAGAALQSPKALESQCADCHAAGKSSPRPEYPSQARLLLERIVEVRELLGAARPLIRKVRDGARRSRLEYAYEQAQVPLTEAVHAGHAFRFEKLEERLAATRERSEALLVELANPTK